MTGDSIVRTRDYTVSFRERQVRNPSGESVTLTSRAFDVLAFLIQHRARVVAKDELIAAVWPRLVVEENNLTQAISSIRRAFNDTRESPQFIVTVAGRGYQWIARVEAVPESSATATSPGDPAGDPSRRLWLAGAGAVAALALGLGGAWTYRRRRQGRRIESIAILPFHSVSPGERDQALELGIAESLINRLSSIESLRVQPLSSVQKYSASGVDALAAARELGVDGVLEGRIQVADDRVRLTARLLDASDGRTLWAGSFDEPNSNLLEVQDALTGRVLSALAVSTPKISASRALLRYTENPDAWRYYLDGRYSMDQRTRAGMEKAVRDFEAALKLDPDFILPMAGLADAWAIHGIFGVLPPVPAFTRSRAAAERALSIDRDFPQARTALGHVFLIFETDFETAERWLRGSVALEPRQWFAEMCLAMLATMRGKFDLAQRHALRARELEPRSIAAVAYEGFLLTLARRYEEARERLESLVAAESSAPLPRHFLAKLELMEGHAEAALALIEGLEPNAPGSLATRGRALAQLGETAGARAELARILELGKAGFGVSYDLAMMHLALGEPALAVGSLQGALKDHSLMFGYMNVDPALDPIRDRPEVRALSERVGRGR